MHMWKWIGWLLIVLGFLALGSYFFIITLPPIGYGFLVLLGSYLVFKHGSHR